MIQPILFTAPHEEKKAERLKKHCLNLDGTELLQIRLPEEPKHLVYPSIANFSFLHCCEVMAGDPFVWLECDSIPLKQDWLKKLTETWLANGKKTLLTKDKHSPFDLCTGIGIWTKDVYRKIPRSIAEPDTKIGFDGYTFRELFGKYAATEQIQHIYAEYNNAGKAYPLDFPRCSWMIRESTLIFHADKEQKLIK